MLQLVELPMQGIQTLHLINRTVKNGSGINSLILDNLEYSEDVSQL